MTRLKPWLAGCVAALATLAILPPLLDLSSWHAPLAREFEQATGRRLQLAGAVHFSLLPQPGLQINDLTLFERDGSSPFAHVDRVQLKLDWLDLLQGQPVITGGSLEGPQINLLRRVDGRLNIEDLFAASAATGKLRWRIQQFSLRDGQLNYQGLREDRARFTGIEAEIDEPLAANGRWRFASQGEVWGWHGKLQADGPLRFDQAQRQLDLPSTSIRFSGADSDWKQTLFGLRGRFQLSLAPWELKISKVEASASAERGQAQWQGAFRTNNVYLEPDTIRTGPAEADVKVEDGSRTIESHFQLGELAGERSSLSLATARAGIDFKLQDPLNQLHLSFTSPLQLAGASELTLPAFELAGDYRHRDLPRAAIPLKQQGQVKLDLSAENINWQSRGMLDHAPLDVAFSMDDFADPRFTFRLQLDKLDLTPYLPLASEEAKTLRPAQTLDLSGLRGWRANGDLRLGELVIGNFRTLNLNTTLQANDGKLRLDPLQADIYQGQLTGSLQLDARSTPSITLKQKLRNMDIQHLLADMLRLVRFEGRGNLDVDLSSHGETLDSLRHNMEGRVDVGLSHGSIRGIDLTAALRQVRSNLAKLAGEPQQPADSNAKTAFSDLKASFAIHSGVAENHDLLLRTALVRVAGGGRLDLARNRIDYLLAASVADNTGVPELNTLRGLQIPIHIGGSLDTPNYRIDYLAIAGNTANIGKSKP